MNFGYIFDLPLRMWPDKEALIYGPHRITYAQLEERTNRVTNGLRALGIGEGDHVAVLVKNDHRFVETMLGALRAGATVTPTTTRAHLSTLAHIMQDSKGQGSVRLGRLRRRDRQTSRSRADAEARLPDGPARTGHAAL